MFYCRPPIKAVPCVEILEKNADTDNEYPSARREPSAKQFASPIGHDVDNDEDGNATEPKGLRNDCSHT